MQNRDRNRWTPLQEIHTSIGNSSQNIQQQQQQQQQQPQQQRRQSEKKRSMNNNDKDRDKGRDRDRDRDRVGDTPNSLGVDSMGLLSDDDSDREKGGKVRRRILKKGKSKDEGEEGGRFKKKRKLNNKSKKKKKKVIDSDSDGDINAKTKVNYESSRSFVKNIHASAHFEAQRVVFVLTAFDLYANDVATGQKELGIMVRKTDAALVTRPPASMFTGPGFAKLSSLQGKGVRRWAENINGVTIDRRKDGSRVERGKIYAVSEEKIKKCMGLSDAIVAMNFSLKAYQLVGVNWLYMLYQMKLDGILADDMGLGKTLQTIAFLSVVSNEVNQDENNCQFKKKPKAAVMMEQEGKQKGNGQFKNNSNFDSGDDYIDEKLEEQEEEEEDDSDDSSYYGNKNDNKKGGSGKTTASTSSSTSPSNFPSRRPHLLIVPTSVVSNWEREIKTFAPTLKVLVYHGSQKEREEIRLDYKYQKRASSHPSNFPHLIIATYTLWEKESCALDRSFFLQIVKPYYMVLDEGHKIKNATSGAHQRIKKLGSVCERRLLATGTPVMNNAVELLVLMSFLMPDIYGGGKAGRKYEEEEKELTGRPVSVTNKSWNFFRKLAKRQLIKENDSSFDESYRATLHPDQIKKIFEVENDGGDDVSSDSESSSSEEEIGKGTPLSRKRNYNSNKSKNNNINNNRKSAVSSSSSSSSSSSLVVGTSGLTKKQERKSKIEKRAVKMIRNYTSPLVLRRMKEDVLDQLPEKLIEIVNLPMHAGVISNNTNNNNKDVSKEVAKAVVDRNTDKDKDRGGQKDIYRDILEASRALLIAKKASKTNEKNKNSNNHNHNNIHEREILHLTEHGANCRKVQNQTTLLDYDLNDTYRGDINNGYNNINFDGKNEKLSKAEESKKRRVQKELENLGLSCPSSLLTTNNNSNNNNNNKYTKVQIRNLFFDLRKAANHPLLLQNYFHQNILPLPFLEKQNQKQKNKSYSTLQLTTEEEREEREDKKDEKNYTRSNRKSSSNGNSNNLIKTVKQQEQEEVIIRTKFDYISDFCYRIKYFGEGHNVTRKMVDDELRTWSDFSLHLLCEEYPQQLGQFQIPMEEIITQSTKFRYLVDKLPALIAKGHKILLFSQWTKILDMLEYVIERQLHLNTSRLDGGVAQQFRQDIIDHFNSCTPFIPASRVEEEKQQQEEQQKGEEGEEEGDDDVIELVENEEEEERKKEINMKKEGETKITKEKEKEKEEEEEEKQQQQEQPEGEEEIEMVPNPNYTPIFLLSTGAGGVGINLTAADIVILHDVGWNPEIDRQAEDRSYRIGQTKNVHVYKLVTKDTVDENIFKCGLRKTEYNQRLLERRKARAQASPGKAENSNEEVEEEEEEKEEDIIQEIINDIL